MGDIGIVAETSPKLREIQILIVEKFRDNSLYLEELPKKSPILSRKSLWVDREE